jgi:hypothetical protein
MPADPEAIFPARFGSHHESHREGRTFSEANLPAFVPEDFEDESEPTEWDVFAFEDETLVDDEECASAPDEQDERTRRPEVVNLPDSQLVPNFGHDRDGQETHQKNQDRNSCDEGAYLRAAIESRVSLLFQGAGCWLLAYGCEGLACPGGVARSHQDLGYTGSLDEKGWVKEELGAGGSFRFANPALIDGSAVI